LLQGVERQPAVDQDHQLAIHHGTDGSCWSADRATSGNRLVRSRRLRDQIRALLARTMTPRLVD
jgi:hypothetical protein